MAVIVVERRENHRYPREVGRITCQSCGSALQAGRNDFTRDHDRDGPPFSSFLFCPVCSVKLFFHWQPFDFELEERAKELYARSQDNLHNLQVRLWHEISEAQRESWRARART